MYTEVNGLEFKNESRTLFFSITDKVGGLDECLKALKGANISLTRIESRPSKTTALGYDFFVDLSVKNKDSEAPEDGDEMKIREAVENLKKISIVDQVHLVGKTVAGVEEEMPWFPRKMIDLDTFAEKVLEMGEELSSDHPGANDPVYRKRRMEITALAKKYKR
ncbi:Phenylalanine-4-hydroxylase [Zancudomyces culisetae]|uniref:phenylalanine 4-monooxygenase n=1 Tax=Zancudomyces culisetae TaxID=1213189 RepID=A0A1R1PX11_ZANCU|nr:Phenylalanine-4-hydroxylase [Zancudomyces culisetae]|eukprot:OMH85481.1 Phenylalanine-4-hydroxylase [Zancudomyces culisetae]